MRLFLIGCEYAGTTTLAVEMCRWAKEEMGIELGGIHDHWKMPEVVEQNSERIPRSLLRGLASGLPTNKNSLLSKIPRSLLRGSLQHYPSALSEEEMQQFLGLSLRMKEAYMRHNLYYHTPHDGVEMDQIMIGYYIEDTIYARLYYHYGGPGMAGDRAVHSKKIEELVARLAPETVLILVKASAETISRRMKQARHPYQVIADTDIDRVSRLFEEAFEASILKNKLILDTTTATVAETLSAFVTKMQPFLTHADRRRRAT